MGLKIKRFRPQSRGMLCALQTLMNTRLSPAPVSKTWTTAYSQGVLQLVEVQVLVRPGMSRFDIIGLPKNMVREGKDRIYAALSSLGVELPSQKILVNLNPGDLPKEGCHFDLPILVGILKCLGHLFPSSQNEFYWGELQLDGRIRELEDPVAHLLFTHQLCPARAALSICQESLSGIREFIRPDLQKLEHVRDLLEAAPTLTPAVSDENHSETQMQKVEELWLSEDLDRLSWNSLRGTPSQFLFWCLAISSRAHVLLEGSPGCGKSTWSSAVRDLLPPLPPKDWPMRFRFRQHQRNLIDIRQIIQAPYEAPHHSSSKAALVGGGSSEVCAGAITRAHRGLLFLDELPQFSKDVIDSLREPLETKTVTIARRGVAQQLPADAQLIAAMNPCPCGNYQSSKRCLCTSSRFWAYRSKLSEPFLDRLHWRVWWKFEDYGASKEFEIKELRRRLITTRRAMNPSIQKISMPKGLAPRRQRLWLECLRAWSKWFGYSEIGPAQVQGFENFRLEVLKDSHEFIA